MAVSTQIVRSYRAPAEVVRAILDRGSNEGRALAYLMAGCAIIFIAQWPRASRDHFLDDTIPLDARIGSALLAWIFIMPLVLYGLAALSRLVARAFGGQGTPFGARIALFWTVLVVSPLMLLRGLVSGFIGDGVEMMITDGVVTLAFFAHWWAALREAERGS